MKTKTRHTLEVFIEKADKLANSRFVQFVVNSGSLTIHASNMGPQPGLQINYTPPDDEAIEAFVLTYRFFSQDNESSSLRNLDRTIDDPDVSTFWKDEVRQVRDILNNHLDQPSYLNLNINGKVLTPREIMDVFIYGHLAHANQQKRETYRSWKQNPLAFPFVSKIFHDTLLQVLRAIMYIAQLSRQELEAANAVEKFGNLSAAQWEVLVSSLCQEK